MDELFTGILLNHLRALPKISYIDEIIKLLKDDGEENNEFIALLCDLKIKIESIGDPEVFVEQLIALELGIVMYNSCDELQDLPEHNNKILIGDKMPDCE